MIWITCPGECAEQRPDNFFPVAGGPCKFCVEKEIGKTPKKAPKKSRKKRRSGRLKPRVVVDRARLDLDAYRSVFGCDPEARR